MKNFAMLSTLGLSLCTVFGTFANASCTQADFRSQDGSQISIRYSSLNLSNGETTWVNPTIEIVLSDEKCFADKVVVDLISSQFGSAWSREETLSRVHGGGIRGCKLSAELDQMAIGNHGGRFGQQIAVKLIDATGKESWLSDSVTGEHNFNYAYQITAYTPTEEVCR